MIRLDKYLSQSGELSRSEAARAVRAGAVLVDGKTVRDPAAHIEPTCDVRLNGAAVKDSAFQYFMLNKPAGVLTAARDSRAQTVMSLVPEALLKRDVLPVGRLDKDTTGLLLLTNDGALAHELLSPKKHVWKRYELTVSGKLLEADAQAFENGIPLGDFTSKPAKLRIIEAGDTESRAQAELREGKFHQVKRMCSALGHEVLKLRRVTFGSLELDEKLPEGGYRELTEAEVDALKRCVRPEDDKERNQNA